MTFNAQDISDKIIFHQTDLEKGDVITNLKLQKLLYYVQGFHLAFFETPLFKDEIEAWMYGPVVPSIYHLYKENSKYSLITESKCDDLIKLSPEVEDMFIQVMKEYGKFSAIRLMEMTHTEKPWIDAFSNPENKTIDLITMKLYFKGLVDG